MHPNNSKKKPFNRPAEMRLRDAITPAAGTRPFRCRAERVLELSFHDLLLPLSIRPAHRTLKSNTPLFGLLHLESAAQKFLEFTVLLKRRSRRLLRPTSHGEPSNCRPTTLNSVLPIRNVPSAPTNHCAARVIRHLYIPAM